jgi:hypothetical protein
MNFFPYFIDHNLFFESDRPKDFEALYSGINTNSGNGLITTCLAKILGLNEFSGGIQNFFTCREEAIDFKLVNTSYSHAFLVLEDHLGGQWNFLDWSRMTALLEKIDLPLIVFSLGSCGFDKTPTQIAGEICEDAVNFFRYLSSRAISIGVRGKTSAKVLDILGVGNYQVVGCPTYFEAGPDRQVVAPKVTADSKVAANGWFVSNTLDNVHYVLQSEIELLRALIDLAPYPQSDAIAFMETAWPNLPEKTLKALETGRVKFYTNPLKWADFFDDSVALTVGTRMHGGIISINKRRPTIVTNPDVRAAEMCALFKIPLYPGVNLCDASPSQLAEMADPTTLNLAYGELYENFRAWLIDICKLPVPLVPLSTLAWDIYQVKMLPGPVVAERIRGAAIAARTDVRQFQFNLEQCEKQKADVLDQLTALQQHYHALSSDHAEVQSQCLGCEARLEAMQQSRSWRITAPLRRIGAFVRSLDR